MIIDTQLWQFWSWSFIYIWLIFNTYMFNLSMKEGSLFLFCFVLQLWDPPNQAASDRVLGVFGKLLIRRGAWAWFHDVWTCGAKVLEYWMIPPLKIKLNRSWKFWRNWNVPLVFLERSWWAGFNQIYLVRFGFRMWEILIFLSDFCSWRLFLMKRCV